MYASSSIRLNADTIGRRSTAEHAYVLPSRVFQAWA